MKFKTPFAIDIILLLLIVGSSYSFMFSVSYLRGVKSVYINTTSIPHHQKTIPEMIVTIAHNNNVNIATAIRIANCESKLGKYKTNWEGSTAKGVYMFTDKTWKNYCTGDVMNDYDNISCFIKLYNKHKSWWKCK